MPSPYDPLPGNNAAVGSQIDTLGAVFMIYGGFQLVMGGLGACMGGAAILMPALIEGDEEAAIVLGILGSFFALTILVLVFGMGGFAILTGSGLKNRKSWARIAAMVLAALSILSFPIGTLIGVFTFVTLLKPEAEAQFR
jgi:hypothetical protein